MLMLDGVEYGSVFCAPGARGFYGEGYPFHRYMKFLGMSWEGTTFVSKTVTYYARVGNMPLKDDWQTPREHLVPKCIVVKPVSGHVLNAVGLSNPGVAWVLKTGFWQAMTQPFMISFMSVAGDADQRLDETRRFVQQMQDSMRREPFRAPVAIQVNRACPNAGHVPSEYYEETTAVIDIVAELGLPIVVNFNPVTPLEVLQGTANHPSCAALWIANTIPWGTPGVDWQGIFGTTESPLARRDLPVPGGGGLSGPACLPIVADLVRTARRSGITKPIVAGNGVQSAEDAQVLIRAGADGIALGVVGMVRPWRMRGIIKTLR